jgi:hypothetical protein
VLLAESRGAAELLLGGVEPPRRAQHAGEGVTAQGELHSGADPGRQFGRLLQPLLGVVEAALEAQPVTDRAWDQLQEGGRVHLCVVEAAQQPERTRRSATSRSRPY